MIHYEPSTDIDSVKNKKEVCGMTVTAYVKQFKGHTGQERSENMQCRMRVKESDIRKETTYYKYFCWGFP